jgi:ABC-2 type transport system ATP-binding protein
MREFLRRRAAQGATVLLSSHLMGELAETVDDVVVIDRGRIIATGTLAEVTGDHPTLEDAYFALTSTGTGGSW